MKRMKKICLQRECFFGTILLFVLAILLYYFPIYGVIWLLPDRLFLIGDIIYKVINPFTLAPIIVGGMFWWIDFMYGIIEIKILFGILYAFSLCISFSLVPSIVSFNEIFKYCGVFLMIVLNLRTSLVKKHIKHA